MTTRQPQFSHSAGSYRSSRATMWRSTTRIMVFSVSGFLNQGTSSGFKSTIPGMRRNSTHTIGMLSGSKPHTCPAVLLFQKARHPWQPYGAVGKVYPELPPYISRLLGISPPVGGKEIEILRPRDLKLVIQAVETLRKEHNHKERAHESLVEDFFVALGYAKHKDIKYRQGRVDIKLETAGHTLLIAEVKAVWDLSFKNGIGAIKQAYGYAHDQGVRYAIVTNGDTYILFDRLKGLSWESNLLGEFQLTALQQEDLDLIDRLRLLDELPGPR